MKSDLPIMFPRRNFPCTRPTVKRLNALRLGHAEISCAFFYGHEGTDFCYFQDYFILSRKEVVLARKAVALSLFGFCIFLRPNKIGQIILELLSALRKER